MYELGRIVFGPKYSSKWCHLRRCSGLLLHRSWISHFIAPCCQSRITTPLLATQPSPPASTTTPVSPSSPRQCKSTSIHCLTAELQRNQKSGSCKIIMRSLLRSKNLNFNYTIIRKDRSQRQRGGILLYHQKDPAVHRSDSSHTI